MSSQSTLAEPDVPPAFRRAKARSRREDLARQALLIASAAWLVFAAFSVWHFTFDDSYIGFRFAWNFARGIGIVYNAGQRVEGYTSFLWVVLLAGASRVGLDVVFASKVLGVLFSLLTFLANYFLCRLLSSSKAPVYGAGLLLTATNTFFIVGCVAGLETPLFTALLSWCLFGCLKAFRETNQAMQSSWSVGTAVLFSLLVMARPDGILIYAVIWLYAAKGLRKQPRALAFFTLPFLLVYAPYFLWRRHYYGLLFPNTFYVKRGGTPALFAKGAADTGKFLGLETGGWFLSGLVGLAVALFPAADTTVLALAIASRIIFELWSGGVSPGEYHFLVSALPIYWILAERVLAGRFAVLRGRGRTLATGVCVFLLAMQVASFFSYRKHHMGPVETGMERAHVALGKWLAANSPPAATVAVGDIGAIGWWSRRKILDLDGLTDTYISHLPGVYPARHDSRYVLRQAPEEVILRASRCRPEAQDIPFGMDKAIHADPQFSRDYRWSGCWEFWQNYDLIVYNLNAQPQSGAGEMR